MQLQQWTLVALVALLSPVRADGEIGTVSTDNDGAAATTTEDTAASGTAAATAMITSVDQLNSGPCFPRSSNGSLSNAAPCRIAQVLPLKCLQQVTGGSGLLGAQPNQTVLKSEQQCFCATNGIGYPFWQNAASNCHRLHGESSDYIPPRFVPSISSSYCGLATPTVELATFLDSWYSTHSADSMRPTDTPTSSLASTDTAISDYILSTTAAAAATGTSASKGGAAPVITAAPIGGAVVAGVMGLAAML